ncbi:MAG: hypothetical protein A3F17_04280 [Gammaproteobacteria bacterium RIFCSPHIGHO2_12_FULL_41_15]|nr:MAG: hypothetical protein A3F17_04280 [Gammaproteobacteria bacterium RIFCSPHIGHO2_12_FULL_41_15]
MAKQNVKKEEAVEKPTDVLAIPPLNIDSVPYVRRYTEECSPINLKVAAALNGLHSVNLNEKFNYLDVGCGNAVSLCAFAAVNPQGHFYGIDSSAEHINYAKQLVETCQLNNVTLIESRIEDLNIDDLPSCDFIVANAFISNVDDDSRYRLLELVNHKLSDHGVYHVVYNAMPGWNVLMPIHELISHGLGNAQESDLVKQLNQNVSVIDELIKHQSAFFKDSVDSIKVFDAIKGLSANAVIHEFMNNEVNAFYFREVVAYQASAGLRYVGSAQLHRNYPGFIIPERFDKMLSTLPDRLEKERLIDFIENTRMRSDIFMTESHIVKQNYDDTSVLDDIYVVCTLTDEQLKKGVALKYKNYKLADEQSKAIIELVHDKSQSVADLLKNKSLSQFDQADIFQRVKVMLALKCLTPCVSDLITDVSRKKIDKKAMHRVSLMNLQLFNLCQIRKMPVPLLSTVTGAAVWTSLPVTKLLLALSASNHNIEKAWELILERTNENTVDNIKANRDQVLKTLTTLKKTRIPLMQRYGMYL